MGLFAPISHFLYAAGMMLVSGSQILYGRYISKDHGRVRSVFSVDLVISFAGSLLVSVFMVLSVLCGWTGVFTSDAAVLGMFNSYLLGQAIGVVPLILGQQLFSFLSLENQTSGPPWPAYPACRKTSMPGGRIIPGFARRRWPETSLPTALPSTGKSIPWTSG